jgi:uncharacterized protein
MKCPIDNTDMVRTTREGIEIDYCPECSGVWLDRGELNKIIDRSVSEWDEIKGKGEKNYPDFSDKRSKPGYESPGHFFGRIFDFKK